VSFVRRALVFAALGALLATLLSCRAGAASLTGRVVGISDGDTLTLLVDQETVRIRLAQIDAPEMGQPYGKRSKQALSDLAFRRDARVQVIEVDDYGRTVGEVYVGDVHVNFEMVRRGHAWAYTRYARSTEIIDLENLARSERLGLWRLPESQRTAPWVWRHERRGSRPAAAASDCGPKRTCGQMDDCEEARRYLACGLTGLDGDGDGIPCESLCER
jgi:endonuclease YncB( thermonuclease family)